MLSVTSTKRPPSLREQVTSRRQRVFPGNHAPPDKEIQIAVSIEVGRHGGAAARGQAGMRSRRRDRELPFPVVEIKPILEHVADGARAPVVLDSPADHVEIEIAIGIRVKEERRHVFAVGIGLESLRRFPGDAVPFSRLIPSIPGLARRAAEIKIVVPVPVDVAAGQAPARAGDNW